MDQKEFLTSVQELRKEKKRNFAQTVDLQILLKNLDIKKQEAKIDLFVSLPNPRGRKITVCGLVGGSLQNDAKEFCDHVILQDDFKGFANDKKALKKLAHAYDFFIAQADIMPAVATTFGRYLGPAGKMPNPKAGAIVPQRGTTKPIVEKLQNLIRVSVKNDPTLKCPVGKEDMNDEEIAANALAVYTAVVNALPQHEQNIRQVILKFTMSQAVTVGGKK